MEIMRRASGERTKISPSAKSKELTSRNARNRLPPAAPFVSLVPYRMDFATLAPVSHPDLESVLFTEAEIKGRVQGLARELKAVYGHREFTLIAIINGAVMFTADLMREIDNPVRLDCVRISSYGNRTKSDGVPQVVASLTLDIAGRDVLIIDDILDTGKTLALVSALVRKLNPASLRTCVLLDKRNRREVHFDADFVGFEIPDKFVVGYGLDYAERYRNLPCIGVLKPSLQNA